MVSKNDQKMLKGITQIHFKTGRSVEGDISEFCFVEGPKGFADFLNNSDRVEELFRGRDVMLINLEQVEFVDIKEVKFIFS